MLKVETKPFDQVHDKEDTSDPTFGCFLQLCPYFFKVVPILTLDFAGKKLSYTDPDTGDIVSYQIFVACLPYSAYSLAMAVRSQNINDFLYALGCCLQELGGEPQVLVRDNLKSAIVKANR